MKVIPVAFDSMGARSMATFIETGDVKILIDPSVALGPKRYGLPPHQREFEKMEELWGSIEHFSRSADIFVITHYHYDHHSPEKAHMFENKKVFIKDPKNRINYSQKRRAGHFLSLIKDSTEVNIADGMRVEVGNTLIEFSPPVPHGTDSRLGYVIMVYVEERDSFLFTSDVEGASLDEQIGWIAEKDARTVIMDGPMTYMLGYRYSSESLQKSIDNLRDIMRGALENLVLDHHLTRDIDWRDKMRGVFDAGDESGVNVLSAAEFSGKKELLLEAMRRDLYREGN